MVTRKTLSFSRFILGARQTAPQQPPQGHGQTPPAHPPPAQPRKRPRATKQTSASPSDAQTQTPPQPSRGVTIREPPAEVRTHVASSSRPVSAWQPSFELDGMPLPVDAYVWVWEKGERGRIA